MKEKSHRVSEVCEKSVDETTLHPLPRRLDGYRLYNATQLQIRQAGGRQVRRRVRQFRWWGGVAQGDRPAAGRDGDRGRLPTRGGDQAPLHGLADADPADAAQ